MHPATGVQKRVSWPENIWNTCGHCLTVHQELLTWNWLSAMRKAEFHGSSTNLDIPRKFRKIWKWKRSENNSFAQVLNAAKLQGPLRWMHPFDVTVSQDDGLLMLYRSIRNCMIWGILKLEKHLSCESCPETWLTPICLENPTHMITASFGNHRKKSGSATLDHTTISQFWSILDNFGLIFWGFLGSPHRHEANMCVEKVAVEMAKTAQNVGSQINALGRFWSSEFSQKRCYILLQ